MNEERLSGNDLPTGVGGSHHDPWESLNRKAVELIDLAVALLAEIRILEMRGRRVSACDDNPAPPAGCLFDEVRRLEVMLINRALYGAGWNKAEAARRLGIRPNTLHYKLRQYGLCAAEPAEQQPDEERVADTAA